MKLECPVMMIPVLEVDDCVSVAQRVHQLRPHWLRRDDKELFTLGAAAYIDAPDPLTTERFGLPGSDNDPYYARARELNSLLRDNFPVVYERTLQALSGALDAKAEFYTGCALPGFHIFGPSPAYASSDAHLPHVDRQYRSLDWKNSSEIDFGGAISFTLPVELPAGGGGLRIWDINLFDVEGWDKDEAKKRIGAAPSHNYDYEVGRMVVHQGHSLHRIAPWNPQPGEHRITVQGHGLFFDDRWNLYW